MVSYIAHISTINSCSRCFYNYHYPWLLDHFNATQLPGEHTTSLAAILQVHRSQILSYQVPITPGWGEAMRSKVPCPRTQHHSHARARTHHPVIVSPAL